MYYSILQVQVIQDKLLLMLLVQFFFSFQEKVMCLSLVLEGCTRINSRIMFMLQFLENYWQAIIMILLGSHSFNYKTIYRIRRKIIKKRTKEFENYYNDYNFFNTSA